MELQNKKFRNFLLKNLSVEELKNIAQNQIKIIKDSNDNLQKLNREIFKRIGNSQQSQQ